MRYAEGFLRIITAVLGLILIAGVILNFTNAFLRYALAASLPWSEEIMVFGMIFIIAIGTVVVTARAEHLRVDVMAAILPRAVRVAAHLLTAGVFFYLAMQSHVVVSLMLRLGQTSVAARVPMWIPHSFLLVAFSAGAVAALYAILREFRPPPPQPDSLAPVDPDVIAESRREAEARK